MRGDSEMNIKTEKVFSKTAETRQQLWKRIKKHKMAYLFFAPALIYTIIFSYSTIYGSLMAFKDYRYDLGIIGSPWAGFKYFKLFLGQSDFWNVIANTFKFSLASLVTGIPSQVILALMLNEMRQRRTKKLVQTLVYLPHFVSWVVVITLFQNMLSPYNGVVNELLVKLFGIEPYYFFGEAKAFLPLYLIIGSWKEIGWCTILYLSTISGIDPTLYEAAMIDGAGRFKQALHITLPSLVPIICLQLIMQAGSILNVSFEQIYLMQMPATIETSEVLSSYTLKLGLEQGQYSLSTAIGLFTGWIGTILMIITNRLSKKYSEVSLW